MQLKPEERVKAIALGAATLGVFGFGILRIMNAMHTSSSSDTAQNLTSGQAVPAVQAALPGASSAIGVPSAPGAPLASITTPTPDTVYGGVKGAKMDLYAEKANDPVTTPDPFTPILPQPNQGIGRYTPAAQPVRPTFVTPSFQPHTTIMPVQPLTRPTALPGANSTALTTPGGKSPLDDVTLAGVISGPSSVAVLHIGDRSFELVGGEKLPYGLSLARITDSGVYMRHNGRMMFMEIGKTLRTAMPIRAGGLPRRAPSRAMLSSAPLSSHDNLTPETETPAVSANIAAPVRVSAEETSETGL